jgi:hypothetical protein
MLPCSTMHVPSVGCYRRDSLIPCPDSAALHRTNWPSSTPLSSVAFGASSTTRRRPATPTVAVLCHWPMPRHHAPGASTSCVWKKTMPDRMVLQAASPNFHALAYRTHPPMAPAMVLPVHPCTTAPSRSPTLSPVCAPTSGRSRAFCSPPLPYLRLR